MTTTATDWPSWKSVRRRRDLTSTAKLIWRTLERICVKRGTARVGLRWLAEDTGVSPAHAHKAVQQLVSLSLLTIEKNSPQGRATYRIPGEERSPERAPSAHQGERKRSLGRARALTGVSASAHQGGHVPHDIHVNNTSYAVPQSGERAWNLFWDAYPRKVGKVVAKKVWDAGDLGKQWDVILKALQRHKQSPQWTRDGGQYIPHPSTWLRQRRWEDEIDGADPASEGIADDMLPPWDDPATLSQEARKFKYRDFIARGVTSTPGWWESHPFYPAWRHKHSKEARCAQ